MIRMWWKRIAVALGIIALVQGIWTSSVWYQYQATLPRHAVQETGNIYPLNVHGIVVYQTREQRDRLDKLDYLWGGLVSVSCLMSFIYVKKFGVPPTPPKPWSPGRGWRSHVP